MNMKKLFVIVVAAILSATAAHADNVYDNMEPLRLTTPAMEPKLDYAASTLYRPELELRTMPLDMADTQEYKLTWMRTNPGVKPYKVMDDLTFVGVPVFLAGLIAKSEKESFAQQRKHALLTEFKTTIDDYTQYFGPVVTTGLKLTGYESRSDWGRYLASTAMSYGIMAALVNGIKYTAKEMRPDGSQANSWPSGHTATSFVGATILHKEYGLTRSPWYSIAGYSVATATGVMRVLNNRHWVSDVLSGAGIGIMSTEIAYALSDVLFKGKGLLRNDLDNTASIVEHPSFFSISMGMGFGSKKIDFDYDGFDFEFRTSTAVAAEGAWFFNKYIGIGGRLRVNSAPINGWSRVLDYANADLKEMVSMLTHEKDEEYGVDIDLTNWVYESGDKAPQFTIESDHLTEFAADLGVYFNIPLSERFAIGSKLLIGRSIMQEVNLDAKYSGQVKDFRIDDDRFWFGNAGKEYTTSWDYFTLSGNNTMKYGTGLSLTYAYKSNFSWKIFVDYDFARKTYTLNYHPYGFMKAATTSDTYALFEAGEEEEEADDDVFLLNGMYDKIKKNRNTWIIGGSFAISF